MNYVIAALILGCTLGAVFSLPILFAGFGVRNRRDARDFAIGVGASFAIGFIAGLALLVFFAGLRWTIYFAFGM